MADFENRDAWEKRLVRGLTQLGKQQVDALLKALGNPPRLSNVPPAFWSSMSADMRAELQPRFEAVYLDMARQTLDGSPIGVDWALINERAATWARGYTFDLVSRLTDRTQQSLQNVIPSFFETPMTFGDLRAKIEPLFGPVRADMIASTEVTRASDQGQATIVRQLKTDNPALVMVEFWETNNDELVCPICGGLQGKRGDGNGNFQHPNGQTYRVPAHPRCRCRRKFVLKMPGTRAFDV